MISTYKFVCISQSITKKSTFGQKDCTIWETREVRESSSIFITLDLSFVSQKRPFNHFIANYLFQMIVIGACSEFCIEVHRYRREVI